jgi:hypothetical protein
MSFDELILSLTEMAATFKDVGNVKQTISDIKSKNLPHHYQKPLVAIANDADRDAMIDRIIAKVFGNENVNPNINSKKELQDALEKAVIEVSREMDSKFVRPVQGVAANYLGRWLGTNINVEYSRGGETELENKGASVIAAKEVLTKTLTPTAKEKEELKQEEQPTAEQPAAKEEGSTVSPTDDKGQKIESLEEEHSIVEHFFNQFEEQVAKLNKKFARDGVPQITIQRTGEEMVPVVGKAKENFGLEEPKLKKIKFKMQVPPLVVPGGWKFIGRVDHTDVGNLIVSVPGTEHKKDLHAMFGKSQPSHCDHCGKVKKRTSTFVVLDEKGKIQRFGRQCLQKYIAGGERAFNQMKDFIKLMSDIAEGLKEMEQHSYGTEREDGGGYDGGGGGGGQSKEFGINVTVGLTLYLLSKGIRFISRKQATARNEEYGSNNFVMPTSDLILSVLDGDLFSKASRVGPEKLEGEDKIAYDAVAVWSEHSEEFKKHTKDFVEWGIKEAQEALKDPNNQYRELNQNLLTVLTAAKERTEAYVPKRYLGTIVSAVARYSKFIEKQKNAELDKGNKSEKEPEFVGVIGGAIGDIKKPIRQKMESKGIKVNYDEYPYNGPIDVTVVNSPKAFSSDFGVSYLYNFKDSHNNRYAYFSTTDLGLEQGDKAKIVRASVKRHDTKYGKSTLIGGNSPVKTVIETGSTEVKESISFEDYYKETLEEKSPCWKGYKQIGMKKKGKKKVPNCVPVED